MPPFWVWFWVSSISVWVCWHISNSHSKVQEFQRSGRLCVVSWVFFIDRQRQTARSTKLWAAQQVTAAVVWSLAIAGLSVFKQQRQTLIQHLPWRGTEEIFVLKLSWLQVVSDLCTSHELQSGNFQLLWIVGVVSVKILAWQESKRCVCSSAGPLRVQDHSAFVAVESSVTVPLADSATGHTSGLSKQTVAC